MTPAWVAVVRETEIQEGSSRVFGIGAEWVALCKVNGRVYAVEDLCPHDTGPLGEGALDGHEIICPRHGARFDVRTGAVRCLPALCGIRTFPARVRGGWIEVEMRPPRSG